MNVALMLELYRRAAVPFVAENVKLFNAMAPADQAELLFYMVMDFASNGGNTNAGTNQGDRPAGNA
jgi:hypothetical protein